MSGCFSILVVDDEDFIRRIVSRVLKRLAPDAQVVEAADGHEAQRQLTELHPDLVVLDLTLPGIDGFHLCKTIKSDSRLQGAKVLAFSGLASEETRLKILAAGADEFLAKPFELEVLAETVRKLLGVQVSP